MNALELTAFGLFGIVLTLAANGLGAQKPYMTAAGGLGIPVEDVLLQEPEPRLGIMMAGHATPADPAIPHGN